VCGKCLLNLYFKDIIPKHEFRYLDPKTFVISRAVIAEKERYLNDENWDVGWTYQLANKLGIPIDNITTSEVYITSIYFTFSSLTSVGFGQ
jgi:hypothetical protein